MKAVHLTDAAYLVGLHGMIAAYHKRVADEEQQAKERRSAKAKARRAARPKMPREELLGQLWDAP